MRPTVLIAGPASSQGGAGMTKFITDIVADVDRVQWRIFDTSRGPRRDRRHRGGYWRLFDAGPWHPFRAACRTGANIARFTLSLVVKRPDCCYLNTTTHWPFWEFAWYMLAAKTLAVPSICHFHGAFDDFYTQSGRLGRALIRCAMRLPAHHIVLTARVQQMLEQWLAPDKVALIPTAVDTELYTPRTPGSVSPPPEVQVLFLGGGKAFHKGLLELVNCLPQVLSANAGLKVTIAASDEASETAADLCRQNGTIDSVRFVGLVPVDQARQLLQESDIFVLPSKAEGVPNAVLEAMACALPVVATSVGGIPDVVCHGETGLLVPYGDVPALADALSRLASDPASRQRMGCAGRQRVEKEFSLGPALDRISDLISNLVSRRKRRTRGSVGAPDAKRGAP